MSMYKQFQTDESLEINGIILDYGDFRVTVARGGGSNRTFTKELEKAMRPHRRAIQAGTMSDKQADAILRTVYAKHIVKKWEVRSDNGWVEGIEGPNGDVLVPEVDNLVQAFAALPDLFRDIVDQSQNTVLFRAELEAQDAGN